MKVSSSKIFTFFQTNDIFHLEGFIYEEYDTGPWVWIATGNETNGTDTTQWFGLADPGTLIFVMSLMSHISSFQSPLTSASGDTSALA